MWMAGAGVKQGLIHGETDEYGWKTVNGQVHVHDLHATSKGAQRGGTQCPHIGTREQHVPISGLYQPHQATRQGTFAAA
jgi:hypothetical protein